MGKKKKTKKDKIITQLKREIKKRSALNNSHDSKSVSLLPKKEKNKTRNHFATDKSLSKQIKTSPLVKKNLTKSFVLAILILSFEFVLHLQIK